MDAFAVALDRGDAALDDVLPVFQEPFEVRVEFGERLDPVLFESLDGIERDEADERAHAELPVCAVGVAQNVVEKFVALVPELKVLPAHVLHRRADVRVVLEELRREALVCLVFLREFERDAHEVEAEHSHPAGRVGLLQPSAEGQGLTSVNHRDVVESEEAALEDVVALAVNLVHPPGEVDEELVETFF